MPVSIIVVTWNHAEATARCLESLGNTESGSKARIIVVDNGSDPPTQNVIRAHESKLNLHVIWNRENSGFARAVNQGITAASAGDDIVLLNNDVVITDPRWLCRLQARALSDETTGLVGCRLVNEYSTLVHAGARMSSATWWGIEVGGGQKDVHQFHRTREVQSVAFALTYIRRAVLDAIGMLDEAYFAYFEDTDFCLRARAAGFKILYFGELQAIHNESTSTQDAPDFFHRIFRASQQVFTGKWEGTGAFRYTSGVVWHSVANITSGYAGSSANILLHLDENHIDVRYKYIYGKDTVMQLTEPMTYDPILTAIQSKPLRNYPVQVAYSQGDLFYKNFGKYKIGFTMLEVDGIPEEWAAQCNSMDEVWVPSTFNIETFRSSGVRVPIHVMPLGIEADYFHPGILPLRLSDKYTFLSVFEWGDRKNGVELIRAFLNEFADDPEVILLLRVFNRDPLVNIANELNTASVPGSPVRIVDGTLSAHFPELTVLPSDRVVIVVNAELPRYQMGRVYTGADCFVLPTCGEGWGLPILEAMACGLPVIATDWSAQRDFLDKDIAYPLRVRRLQPAISKCPYYKGLKWAEPDMEHFASLMRRVYERRQEAEEKGARAAGRVADAYSWPNAIQPMIQRLREIDV